MNNRVHISGLQVADELYEFINDEALPHTGITQDNFGLRLPPY